MSNHDQPPPHYNGGQLCDAWYCGGHCACGAFHTAEERDAAAFWAGIRRSAALVSGLPSYTGAGVLDHNAQVAMMGGVRNYVIPAIPIDPEADAMVDRLCAERTAGRKSTPLERRYTRDECDALIASERERVLVAVEDGVVCSDMREPEREHVEALIAKLRQP